MHAKDSDCTVGQDGCCEGCGVSHGAPCDACGGRGFHTADCVEERLERIERNEVESVRHAASLAKGVTAS